MSSVTVLITGAFGAAVSTGIGKSTTETTSLPSLEAITLRATLVGLVRKVIPSIRWAPGKITGSTATAAYGLETSKIAAILVVVRSRATKA